MQDSIEKSLGLYVKAFNDLSATNADGLSMPLNAALAEAAALIVERTNAKGKVIFVGNGGSAGIASHQAVDFWKNGGIRALAFNDSSLLTCLGNDYGYEFVFEKSIDMFADKGDILIAISSSGKSENILRGARSARKKGCKIVTLSGFKEDNPLSSMGDFNFYVPAQSYGPVEIIHHSICHCLLDVIINHRQTQ